MAPATQKRTTIDVPPSYIMAAVGSVDEEHRTVELVFSTGATFARFDFLKGRYNLRLSLDPKHVRLDRLNSGAPLLNAHSTWDLSHQIGVVVDGSAVVDGKEARCTVRFSSREDVEPIWQDVKDGIIRNVSVGASIHKYEEKQGKDEDVPTRTAVDWEPNEVSLVPVGADAGAKVRAAGTIETNPCVVVTHLQEESMAKRPDETNPGTPEVPPKADPDTAQLTAEAVKAERERVKLLEARAAAGIAGGLAEQEVQEMLTAAKDGDETVDQFGGRILEKLALNSDANGPKPNAGRPDIVGGDDARDKLRAGMVAALCRKAGVAGLIAAAAKMDPSRPEFQGLDLDGGPFVNMRLSRMAEECAKAAGARVDGLPQLKIAGIALGNIKAAGQHSTSDFPFILEDVANKTLRAAYLEAPQTFQPISRRVTLPDFKPVRRVQLGEAPQMLEVGEAGEFTVGTIGEGKETYSLATYGRRFAITRQALINDDMDAFSRLPMLFGRSSRDLESDLVWAHFASNPTMGDNVALFDAAHGNVGIGTISIAGLSAGRAAMRKQTGLAADQFINVMAKYLLVPVALETLADQFVSQNMRADSAAQINVFAGRLQVIAEPRLDATSEVEWYLVADPGQIDTIEYAYLEGEDGPMLESRLGFEVDGLELRARHDFAAKSIDHRGFYQSDGVDAT